MILPKKDKDGRSYLSYSQIKSWRDSKRKYIREKMCGEPFVDNAYTIQGKKVGEALENNDFSGFTKEEQELLSTIPRLDEFEKRIEVDMGNYYIVGYIDSNTTDCSHILDYKQGIIDKKEAEYDSDDYVQLHIYAEGIRQETGKLPKKAEVILVDRVGNAFQNQKLVVGDRFVTITKDISKKEVDKVLADIQQTAEEISAYYKVFLKLKG